MKRLILSALLALPLAATAQPVDVAELDALFGTEPQVEVNLRGSLLRLAAQATAEDSPETAAMLDGLRAVTVRIYPSPEDVRGLAVDRFTSLGRQFESQGWYTLVRVRALEGTDTDDESDVWVYVRDAEDVFDGLAVMVVDQDEENAVYVYIDGTIDPADVSALSRRFARVDLDDDEADDE